MRANLTHGVIRFLSCVCLLTAFICSNAMAAQGPLVNAATLSITTGGTWQAMFPVNTNRSTIWVENPCNATSQGIATAESLFVAFGNMPTTTAGAFELTSCGSLVMTGPYVSQQAVWVYGATTSHAFIGAQSQ